MMQMSKTLENLIRDEDAALEIAMWILPQSDKEEALKAMLLLANAMQEGNEFKQNEILKAIKEKLELCE